MNIKEIHKMSEKDKWFDQFRKAYSGGCVKKMSSYAYDERFSRFLVAVKDGKEMGYIRISSAERLTPEFRGTWVLSEAYIKPPYRGDGVLRELLIHSIDYFNVKMVHLTEDRYSKNFSYYSSLGFTAFVSSGECTGHSLGHACFKDALKIFKNRGAYLAGVA